MFLQGVQTKDWTQFNTEYKRIQIWEEQRDWDKRKFIDDALAKCHHIKH